MSRHEPPQRTRTPFILLGLLTLSTVGGPLAILLTIRGGVQRGWPPDRPIEWWAFGLSIVAEVVLMAACLAVGLLRWRRTPLYSPRDGAVDQASRAGAGAEG
jgi:hypothetical protein